jgi:hypothetical protein
MFGWDQMSMVAILTVSPYPMMQWEPARLVSSTPSSWRPAP